MASTETLTSLAMLKVNIDQGRDYLDYLRPFVMQVLVDEKPDPVTDGVVRDCIRTIFGLEIPDRAVQLILKRISRSHPLKCEYGKYQITGDLPNPGITAKKSEAHRHIDAVISGLMDFSKETVKPLAAPDDAVKAVCTFLEEFSIDCIRAYLRGTAIPAVEDKQKSDVVLVSEYVVHLRQTDPERFDSFMIMVQGHMLANALTCPDLELAPKNYNRVTFYLDTPLLIRRLGLEGAAEEAAIEYLIGLLYQLGGTVATFSHSRDELEHVVRGAADYINAWNGRGAIVREARRKGTTKSDLLILAGQIDDRLAEAKIDVIETPQYIADFQIDEEAFEKALQDEVSYFNPRAKEYDINSVRSIYVLRGGLSPFTVEKSKAVLTTSNSGFARAAYEYGQKYDATRQVSSVITDFSLANMAWLKAPMGAPSLPTTETVAFSYAALQPSRELLSKFLAEADKLQAQGKITARDHQLLRSTVAHEELMHLTLGDEEALSEETVTETLRRVSGEIKKEESEKLTAEQEAHLRTQVALASQLSEKSQLRERLYWRCQRRARWYAWSVSGLSAALIVAGLIGGLGLAPRSPILGYLLAAGSATLIVLSTLGLFLGTTVKGLHQSVQDRFLTWFIKREARDTGIDLGDLQ